MPQDNCFFHPLPTGISMYFRDLGSGHSGDLEIGASYPAKFVSIVIKRGNMESVMMKSQNRKIPCFQ